MNTRTAAERVAGLMPKALTGRVVVVKIGGGVAGSPDGLATVASDLALIVTLGARLIVVHGGGPQIDATLRALGRVPRRVDGIRVTDDATLEVVEMVLCGCVGPSIVSALSARGLRAVPISGRSGRWMRGVRAAPVGTDHAVVDRGRIADFVEVATELPRALVASGVVPVVAPIAVDERGEPLNVNADVVAGAIAAAVRADALVLVSEVGAILDAECRPLAQLDLASLGRLREARVIDGGMVPKLDAAARLLAAHAVEAFVLPPRAFAITSRLLGDPRHGTRLTFGASATNEEHRA